jgi:hypothetical protein
MKCCPAGWFGFSRRVSARPARRLRQEKFLKSNNSRKLPADNQMEHEMNCSRYFLAMLRAASLAGVASIVVVSADGAYAHGRGDHDHSRKGNARPTETVRIVNTIHPIIVGKGHHRHDGDDHKHRYPYPGRVPIGGPLPPQPAPVGMPKPPPPAPTAPPAPPAPTPPAQTAPAPMPPAPSGGLTPGGGRDPGRPPTRAQ